MAGRPQKKPRYNSELQFQNLLQELREAYEESDSLRMLAWDHIGVRPHEIPIKKIKQN